MCWLRAKARYDRWSEESQLVELEMGWTVNWFRWKEQQWAERLDQVANDDRAGGLDSYCHKQIGLWREFAVAAGERFVDILGHPCGS